MNLVVPLAEARDASLFGPKAAQLAVLGDVPGARVPEGFAVSSLAFEATLGVSFVRKAEGNNFALSSFI